MTSARCASNNNTRRRAVRHARRRRSSGPIGIPNLAKIQATMIPPSPNAVYGRFRLT